MQRIDVRLFAISFSPEKSYQAESISLLSLKQRLDLYSTSGNKKLRGMEIFFNGIEEICLGNADYLRIYETQPPSCEVRPVILLRSLRN